MGFRTVFPHIAKANWFPLHMATGLRKIQRIMRDIDCVIEIHDARIPVSGRSSSFHEQVICGKPHLLILNKSDLIDMNFKNDIDKKLLGTCDRILYTSALPRATLNLEKIVPMAHELMEQKPKFNRADKIEVNLLIVGVPNVGKSTIINNLRSILLGKKQVMAVAPQAGVTKTISTRLKISNDPLTYIYDTPGILEPTFSHPEAVLRLAVCGLIKEDVIGLEKIADYILFWFNRRKLFHYANIFGLNEPTDSVIELLTTIAIKRNFTFVSTDMSTNKAVPRLNLQRAADYFIKKFRDGTIGTYVLDDDLIYQYRKSGLKIAV